MLPTGNLDAYIRRMDSLETRFNAGEQTLTGEELLDLKIRFTAQDNVSKTNSNAPKIRECHQRASALLGQSFIDSFNQNLPLPSVDQLQLTLEERSKLELPVTQEESATLANQFAAENKRRLEQHARLQHDHLPDTADRVPKVWSRESESTLRGQNTAAQHVYSATEPKLKAREFCQMDSQ